MSSAYFSDSLLISLSLSQFRKRLCGVRLIYRCYCHCCSSKTCSTCAVLACWTYITIYYYRNTTHFLFFLLWNKLQHTLKRKICLCCFLNWIIQVFSVQIEKKRIFMSVGLHKTVFLEFYNCSKNFETYFVYSFATNKQLSLHA